jgi:aminodeoxyfutalosine deaminase
VSAASANWASRSTGSSTPCATSPSKRPNASFAKPPNARPQYPSIVGIGLGGDERQRWLRTISAPLCRSARAGLRLTNHAGETTGPEAIWEALAIGSERIGHALSAIEDPDLLQELKSAKHSRWS